MNPLLSRQSDDLTVNLERLFSGLSAHKENPPPTTVAGLIVDGGEKMLSR